MRRLALSSLGRLLATALAALCLAAPAALAEPPAPRLPGAADHAHQRGVDVPLPPGVGLDERLGARLPLDLIFTDEEGRPVRLGDLVTRPTVIAPVYFRCPNVCHFLQGELARTLAELRLVAGSDYQVLSVSFDEHETAELARRTRNTYLTVAGGKVDAAGWRFLTGDAATIKTLTDAIGYRFQRTGSDFQHPVAIVVVSADGTIARYLHGTRVLPKDLALAIAEARQGLTGTTIRKMVQYCFSYDPEQKTYLFNVLRVAATVILATLAGFLAWLLIGGRRRSKDFDS